MKVVVAFLAAFLAIPLIAQQYTVSSPDKSVKVDLSVGKTIEYSITIDGISLLTTSGMDITIDKLPAGLWKIKKVIPATVDQTLKPVVAEKAISIRDNYNELKIQFTNRLALTFRVFNNGAAYRWESVIADSITIVNETVRLGFDAADKSWYPAEKSFYSHNERLYKQYTIKQLTSDSLASLPALVNHNGINVLVTEADLFDYPGMWLVGNGDKQLHGIFPAHAAVEKATGDRDILVTERDKYLAKTIGTRTFPWRVLMIGRNDADLLNNSLVYQLSTAATADFSWVKPGKVAWDWWNALNVEGVSFISGVNTETYKYYIDFAAQYGLDYIILDEGWSPATDITHTIPELNMPDLLAYARQKKVGVILWVLWTSLNDQMIEAMDLYASWGIKGIKVDFMQRDDQKMVNFYERTAIEAAKRKLMVDFHGAYKPTGMERKYPHVITREGVYGLEQSKWDVTRNISPEHNVTLPFIRNAVGPMDYTPGAMINAQHDSWAPVFQRPMSLGTRCHQLAMYVVFTSPLQMLSDVPSNYYREPTCMEFLREVPSVWSESVGLEAKTGDFVSVARKAMNGDWYVGAMTDWTARDIQLNFSFLDEGNYVAEIWQDGVNANRNANDFARKTVPVNSQSSLMIHMAPGGGWAAIIKPLK